MALFIQRAVLPSLSHLFSPDRSCLPFSLFSCVCVFSSRRRLNEPSSAVTIDGAAERRRHTSSIPTCTCTATPKLTNHSLSILAAFLCSLHFNYTKSCLQLQDQTASSSEEDPQARRQVQTSNILLSSEIFY